MDNRRQSQSQYPQQQQPNNPRNPMGTHGGSINLRNPQHAQAERTPSAPLSGSGSNTLQRQQQQQQQRAPLVRTDTPVVAQPGMMAGRNPPQPQFHRGEKRVLPIGGPVHISHRGDAPLNAPNARGSLKRQTEIDETGEQFDRAFAEADSHFHAQPPNRFSGDFDQPPSRHSGDFNQPNRHSGDFTQSHHQSHPSQHHKPRQQSGHGSRHGPHQHEPLSARNSTDSTHGHLEHHGRQHSQSHPHHHRPSDAHIDKHIPEKYKDQYIEDERLKRAREKKIEEIKREIRKEKRVMLAASAISLFFGILWLIAVCLSYWYYVYADEHSLAIASKGIAPPTIAITSKNTTQEAAENIIAVVDKVTDVFVSSHTGLWRVCRTKRYIPSGNERVLCYWHNLFPTEDEIKDKAYTDKHIVDYQRTEVSFAIISLIIMGMTVPAALYTLQDTRYMFKRLAAGLYFVSAITVLVVVEVTITKIEHESTKPYLRPPKSTVSHGFCFIVGWMVFSVNLITCVVYLLYSRKRKGENALDDDEEERIIGR